MTRSKKFTPFVLVLVLGLLLQTGFVVTGLQEDSLSGRHRFFPSLLQPGPGHG